MKENPLQDVLPRQSFNKALSLDGLDSPEAHRNADPVDACTGDEGKVFLGDESVVMLAHAVCFIIAVLLLKWKFVDGLQSKRKREEISHEFGVGFLHFKSR